MKQKENNNMKNILIAVVVALVAYWIWSGWANSPAPASEPAAVVEPTNQEVQSVDSLNVSDVDAGLKDVDADINAL